MREVTLQSGAVLKVAPAPFIQSKNLYQALLRELKTVVFDKQTMPNVWKDLFCSGFSSLEVEKPLWECMTRCLLNGERITPDTFEPVERRDDYMQVCMEVAKENVTPFAKSLYAEFLRVQPTTADTPA